ncbi:hypothetical protein JL722_1611 [Aureococcus anophagefferens]|nr:hypothetical protein JL722_1611 [Aureococcus anophagefferens]
MPASTYHVAPMPTHAHVAEKHEEVRVRTGFGHKSKPKTLQEAMKMRGDPGERRRVRRRRHDRAGERRESIARPTRRAKKERRVRSESLSLV